MQELDLASLRSAPLVRTPFEYLILPCFVRPEALAAVNADFPNIDKPGSFPVCELSCGPAFTALLETLRCDAFRAAFEEKFALPLKDRPTTVTVRGRCSARDGHIHTDSATKL